MIDNDVYYTLTNLVYNDIEESCDFSKYGVCCATYVSIVLYKTGLVDADTMNRFPYHSAGGLGQALQTIGWTHVPISEAQPGDVAFWYEHIFIYAGKNEVWGCNCGCVNCDASGTTRPVWEIYKNNGVAPLTVLRMPQ